MSAVKRGSVSRRGVRLRGEGSGTMTSISGKEGKCSGDRVGGGGVGRMRRRDLDTRRVRERRGRFGMW